MTVNPDLRRSRSRSLRGDTTRNRAELRYPIGVRGFSEIDAHERRSIVT